MVFILIFLSGVFIPEIRQDYGDWVGEALWLGIFAGYMGGRARKSLSVRPRLSKKGLNIWFRSKRYRDEFVSKNDLSEAGGWNVFV